VTRISRSAGVLSEASTIPCVRVIRPFHSLSSIYTDRYDRTLKSGAIAEPSVLGRQFIQSFQIVRFRRVQRRRLSIALYGVLKKLSWNRACQSIRRGLHPGEISYSIRELKIQPLINVASANDKMDVRSRRTGPLAQFGFVRRYPGGLFGEPGTCNARKHVPKLRPVDWSKKVGSTPIVCRIACRQIFAASRVAEASAMSQGRKQRPE
jgi:hypothetical protein